MYAKVGPAHMLQLDQIEHHKVYAGVQNNLAETQPLKSPLHGCLCIQLIPIYVGAHYNPLLPGHFPGHECRTYFHMQE